MLSICLNAVDDGNRRCILVTNNEVSVDEAKELDDRRDCKPGDPQWDSLGIARHVTWPRTVWPALQADAILRANLSMGNYGCECRTAIPK